MTDIDTRTVWLRKRQPLVLVDDIPVRVIAYDPAYDLCLVEYESGERETHVVGTFWPSVGEDIRNAATAEVVGVPRPPSHHPWLDLLAVACASGLVALACIAVTGALR